MRHDGRLGAMLDTSKSPPDRTNPGAGIPTQAEAAKLHPGGSGPIRELAQFYQRLMNALAGSTSPILSPESILDLIHPHRRGMYDHTFKHIMDWGLGFMLNTQRDPTLPYSFGQHASAPAPSATAAGKSSCTHRADPEYGLIIAWLCNGMPGEDRHYIRQRAMNDAIYEILGSPIDIYEDFR